MTADDCHIAAAAGEACVRMEFVFSSGAARRAAGGLCIRLLHTGGLLRRK